MTTHRHFVHAQALAQLDKIARSGEPPLETLPPAEARRRANERVAGNGWARVSMHHVADRTLEGPGGPLRTRLYQPTPTTDLPLILFFHGGGFMVGNLETHDSLCRVLASRTGAAVLAVDYRLAPENPFPAAQEDCLFVTRWAQEHASALGVDAGRIAVAGESSGGNLTAVVAQAAASAGTLHLRLQVMIYPSLDMGMKFNSFREYADGYFFTRTKAQYFINHFLRSPQDVEDVRASPLRATSLARVAPALIITAGLDPMVDEAAEYAKRLREAGVKVDYRVYEGWPHGFLFWSDTDAARSAMDAMVDELRLALEPQSNGARSS